MQRCANPLGDEGGNIGQTGQPGIAIRATAQEFYTSFASIFSLSDGSKISVPTGDRVESLRYIQVTQGNPQTD
jgi:hypothetical protein